MSVFKLAPRAWWILAIWWLWMPAVTLLIWSWYALIAEGMDWRRDFELFIMRNVFPGGLNIYYAAPLFWIIMGIGAIGSVVIIASTRYVKVDEEVKGEYRQQQSEQGYGYRQSNAPSASLRYTFDVDRAPHTAMAVLLVWSIASFIYGVSDNPKDEGRHYNTATVYYTPTLDENSAPGSVTDLLKGASRGDGKRCDLVGRHDVPSCINEGTMPNFEWEPRVASLAGATHFLSVKTGDKSNVSLMKESVTYLHNQTGTGGKWTGIRDGSGTSTSTYGVVEWDGVGDPTECYFNKNDFNLRRAFNGTKGNSLVNYIAEKYRPYRYDTNDVWGYCNDNEPIIVIPLKEEVRYNARTVETAAGVLIMRGSYNGEPDLDHRTSANSGEEIPGPVYPQSLVAKQRDMLQWATGERNRNDKFGYEPTDDDSQKGNASEYLMREVRTDKKPPRTFWMTPLTTKGDSKLFVAYVLTRADQVHAGSLNQLTTYVTDSKDPRQLSLDTLDYIVWNVISARDPGFLASKQSPGRIVEYLPLDSHTWQVYAERDGVPAYVITIPVKNTEVQPTIATIDVADGTVHTPQTVRLKTSGDQPDPNQPPQQPQPSDQPAPPAGELNCGKPEGEMTDAELAACAGRIADEQQRRHPR